MAQAGPRAWPAPSSTCLSVLCHFLPVLWPVGFIILETLPQLCAFLLLLFCLFRSSVSWRQRVSGTSFQLLAPPSVQASGASLRGSWPDTVLFLSPQSPDILSTAGYDNIIQHLNNGRKNCKEFEDFLKERYRPVPL